MVRSTISKYQRKIASARFHLLEAFRQCAELSEIFDEHPSGYSAHFVACACAISEIVKVLEHVFEQAYGRVPDDWEKVRQ
jgi:hypothetical protein